MERHLPAAPQTAPESAGLPVGLRGAFHLHPPRHLLGRHAYFIALVPSSTTPSFHPRRARLDARADAVVRHAAGTRVDVRRHLVKADRGAGIPEVVVGEVREADAAVREHREDRRASAAAARRVGRGGQGRHVAEDVRRLRHGRTIVVGVPPPAVEEALVQRRGLVEGRARGPRESRPLQLHPQAEGAVGVAGGGCHGRRFRGDGRHRRGGGGRGTLLGPGRPPPPPASRRRRRAGGG